MSIHNDISDTYEIFVKNQSEMQSCKADESESRPNIALKRIGQELDKAETKCFTLKSELNYVMDVCRKAQIEIRGSKEASDSSPIIPLFKHPSKSQIKHNSCNSEIMDINRITNCNISQRIHDIELKAEENFDNFNLSPRSARFSFTDDDDTIERSERPMEGKQEGLLNVTITPRIQLDKKLPRSITTMPIQNTEAGEEYESYYFQSSVSLERLTSQANEDYLRATQCFARRGVEDFESIEGPGLNLNTKHGPNVAKARRVMKSRSKTGRSEMNSVYRADNAVSKTRKRKAKLRCSVSKSTVTTKDTGFIGRKEAKRRRHKGGELSLRPGHQSLRNRSSTVQQSANPPKNAKKFNEIIDIFHNTRLKNNNSEVSSKHSKIDGAKREKKPHLSENKKSPRRIQETSVSSPRDSCVERVTREHVNRERQSHDKKIEQDHCLQTLNDQSNSLSKAKPEVAQEQNKSEKQSDELSPAAQDETQQCERVFNRHDDPLFTPNYEMPTLASKLKRSGRSYFSRFNFQNIPFVVGTSVTPSYNLGLNIQQVLSMMKTRQPIANDVTPLLIRKVSRGMRPMSDLLDQMNGHYEGSVSDVSPQMIGPFNNEMNFSRDRRLSAFNLQHVKTQGGYIPKVSVDAEIISKRENNVSKQFHEEGGDSRDPKIRQQCSSAVSKSNTASLKIQQGISRISLKGNNGNHKIRMPDSHNSKEIREVLINLHDQFEEMNTKYERLQSEVDKSSDKSLAKKLSILEKQLNAKEEEINAVVGLYKEVMTLKQQMKVLHERNSLVCIATEPAKETKDSFPTSVVSGKSHSMNLARIFNRRKTYNATTRELPASMQLAALLRQIQTFHKQLQLVS